MAILNNRSDIDIIMDVIMEHVEEADKENSVVSDVDIWKIERDANGYKVVAVVTDEVNEYGWTLFAYVKDDRGILKITKSDVFDMRDEKAKAQADELLK
jgi:hypothetical protein